MAKIIFWISFIFIFYSYFGYPLVLYVLSFFKGRSVKKGDITPNVSVIITAFNEERNIKKKIENILAQNYPKERLEILVASDCSSDRTDEIVKSFESKGIRLIRSPERKGKEGTQKLAVEVASCEILVFSDVATIIRPDGISNIVRNFADTTVGCVSSVDRFMDRDGNISGEGAYVRYEMYLRNLESKVNSLVGLSGSFFATRKENCEPWEIDLQSDFNTLLNAIKKGTRGISDMEAIGYYTDLSESKQEFNRKVRTIVRGIRVLMRNLSMFNVFKYGLFSWQLFSHKLCRWVVPFWLMLAFASNLLLIKNSMIYLSLFVVQAALYLSSVTGILTKSKNKVLMIPFFFFMVNLSILIAWYKYLKGEQFVKWEPSAR